MHRPIARTARPSRLAGALLGAVSLALALGGSAALAADFRIVTTDSRANYRVTERLAGVSLPVDAVGVTGDVDGVIRFDDAGAVLEGSSIRVGLAALASDQARRDGYLGRTTLETGCYPDALFVPTEVRGLAFPLPESGSASFEIVGDLTLRDTTRRVVWQAEASFDGARVRLDAATVFTFDEFGLEQPIVGLVLSVEDDIRLETSLLLERTE